MSDKTETTRTVTIDADHPAIRYFIEGWAHLHRAGSTETTASAAHYLQQQIEAQAEVSA